MFKAQQVIRRGRLTSGWLHPPVADGADFRNRINRMDNCGPAAILQKGDKKHKSRWRSLQNLTGLPGTNRSAGSLT